MKKILVGLMAASLLLAGCAGKKSVVKIDPNARPDWTEKGGIFQGETGSVIYGVGIADKGPNTSLLREKADSRARSDLATQMKTAVKKLTMDFMSDHKDYFDAKNTSGSDEMTTVVSKSVVDQVLIGSHVVDRWADPETGALYSLARLDVSDGFYDSYQQALKRTLRTQHRLQTEERMNEALGQLDKEVENQRQHEKEIMGITAPAPAVQGN